MKPAKRFLPVMVASSIIGLGAYTPPVCAGVTLTSAVGQVQSDTGTVYEALEGNGYTGSASGNTLTADGITVSGNVYGGHTETENGAADKNTVTLTNSTAAGVWGGKAGTLQEAMFQTAVTTGGSANSNTVTLGQGAVVLQKAIGGEAAKGSANNNRVVLQGMAFGHTISTSAGSAESSSDTIYGKSEVHPASAKINIDLMAGGISSNSDASYNVVQASDLTLRSTALVIFGGRSQGSAKENQVTLSLNTPSGANLYVFGGSAVNGTADSNSVTVTDSGSGTYDTVTGGISLAHPEDLSVIPDGDDATYGANNNQVQLKGVHVAPQNPSSFSSGVYGGYSSYGTANGNSVSIQDSSLSSVLGAYSMMGCTSGNQVEVSSSVVKDTSGNTQDHTAGLVIGGLSQNGRAANDNQVTLTAGTQAKSVYGGVGVLGTATGNSVTITDSTVDVEVVGGQTGDTVGWIMYSAQPQDAENNQVTLSGTSSVDTVVGGEAAAVTTYDEVPLSGKAVGNKVTITGGTVKNSVLGGHSALSDATGNTVTIAGGTLGTEAATTGEADDNVIAGGFAENGAATGNTVNITGGSLGTLLSLYGGYSDKESTGNTLNLYTKGNTVKNVQYFQALNFYVPAGTAAGDTLLEVTGTADVHGAAISAGVNDAVSLQPGEVINLLHKGNAPLLTEGASYSMVAGQDFVTDPGFVQHKVLIKKQDPNTVVLYIPAGDKGTLNPDTKLIPEQREAAISQLVNASDLASNHGYASAVAAYEAAWLEDHSVKAKFTPYAVVGGHDLRYATGSYVDSQGISTELGFVKRVVAGNHTDTVMPFAEYGNGNYTAHLDSGARSDGGQHYIGGGLLLRRDLSYGAHYEGMVRAGYLSGDFRGLLAGHQASYATGSSYVAAHLGLGKVVTRGRNDFDYYGKLYWTHLGSDTTRIYSGLGGGTYHLDSVDSYRSRLGLRWTRHQGAQDTLYAGLGWDYEFDGEARAQYRDFSTPAPSVQGSSGFVELGWQSKATKENPWGADVRVTGWSGVQRGFTYGVTITRRM